MSAPEFALFRWRWKGEIAPTYDVAVVCALSALVSRWDHVYAPRIQTPCAMRFSALTCNELYVEDPMFSFAA